MSVRVVRPLLFACLFALLTRTFTAAQSAPQITEVTPAAKAHGGDTVTIRGTNFGAGQGTGILRIRGTSSITVTSWNDTEIVAIAPNYSASTATWGIQVTQNGVAGNQFPYEIVRPVITSITPSAAWAGSTATVNGTNLRATQKAGDWVMIGGQLMTVSTWSDTQVTGTISPWATPTGVTQAFVSDYSPAYTGFTLLTPQITAVSPTSGRALDTITITGTDFGTPTETAFREVRIANRVVTATSWTNTEIIAPAPYYYSTSTPDWGVRVRQGAYSNIAPFTLFRPSITNITPSSAFPGASITITGTGFGPSHDPDVILWVAGYPAQTTSWSDTQIVATVPSYPAYAPPTTTTSMYVREYSAGYVGFTALLPQLTEVSPAIASAGTQVVITGSNFGASQGSGTVKLGGLLASVTGWNDTQVVAVVPPGATTTTTAIVRQGQDSNAVTFNIVGPSITNQPGPAAAPGQGAPVISGARFGTSQGSSTVTFGGLAATSCPNWNDTWVACVVPVGATSGSIVVTVNGIPSNAVPYTVAPHAHINSIDPPAAPVGNTITISGYSFYDSPRSVYFPGAGFVNVPAANWSDTSITLPVPAGATSGGVFVRSYWRGDSQPHSFTVPPNITGLSLTAAPVGTQITITGTNFGATQASGVVYIGGMLAPIASWANTTITATVPQGAGNSGVQVVQGIGSNISDFIVVVPPIISYITPEESGPNGWVRVVGNNFGAAQGSSTVTVNGLTALTDSWTNASIWFQVSPDFESGPVIVTVNGFASNSVPLNFKVGIRDSLQSVYILPDEMAMIVGETRALKLYDAQGSEVPSVTWTVRNENSDDLTTTVDPGQRADTFAEPHLLDETSFETELVALAPGRVRVIAQSALGTAQASATIYLASEIPAALPRWTLYPQTSNTFIFSSLKADRQNPDAPSLFAFETEFWTGDSVTVNALDEDGALKWRTVLQGSSNNIAHMAMNDGALLVLNRDANTFHKLGSDGTPAWNYAVTSANPYTAAVAPDDTIYFKRGNTIAALDGSSGQPRFTSVNTPQGASTFISEEVNPDPENTQWVPPCATNVTVYPQIGGQGEAQEPIVGTDGNAYFLMTVTNATFRFNQCAYEQDPASPPGVYRMASAQGTMTKSSRVYVIGVDKQGQAYSHLVDEVTSTFGYTRTSFFSGFANGGQQEPAVGIYPNITPDPAGGIVLQWSRTVLGQPMQLLIGRFLQGQLQWLTPRDEDFAVAVGENDTVLLQRESSFTATGKIVALDLNTGAERWTRTDARAIIAATEEGGAILGTNAYYDTSIFKVDENGQVTSDTVALDWYPSIDEAGKILITDLDYGTLQRLETSSIVAELATTWPTPFTGDVSMRKAAGKGRYVEFVDQNETAGCTGFDKKDKALMVGENKSNKVWLTKIKSGTLRLEADDPTKVSISPNIISANTQQDSFEITLTGLVKGTTTIRLRDNLDPTKVIGQKLLVDVKPLLSKKVDFYRIVDGTLMPPNVPTAASLQAVLDRTFLNQANVAFTVQDQGNFPFHYDLDSDDSLKYERIDGPNDTEYKPLRAFFASGLPPSVLNDQNQMFMFYVNKIKPPKVGGFALRFIRSYPAVVYTDFPSFPVDYIETLTAHELGHVLGSEHNRKSKDLLMYPSHLNTAPGVACGLTRKEWKTINPVP